MPILDKDYEVLIRNGGAWSPDAYNRFKSSWQLYEQCGDEPSTKQIFLCAAVGEVAGIQLQKEYSIPELNCLQQLWEMVLAEIRTLIIALGKLGQKITDHLSQLYNYLETNHLLQNLHHRMGEIAAQSRDSIFQCFIKNPFYVGSTTGAVGLTYSVIKTMIAPTPFNFFQAAKDAAFYAGVGFTAGYLGHRLVDIVFCEGDLYQKFSADHPVQAGIASMIVIYTVSQGASALAGKISESESLESIVEYARSVSQYIPGMPDFTLEDAQKILGALNKNPEKIFSALGGTELVKELYKEMSGWQSLWERLNTLKNELFPTTQPAPSAAKP